MLEMLKTLETLEKLEAGSRSIMPRGRSASTAWRNSSDPWVGQSRSHGSGSTAQPTTDDSGRWRNESADYQRL